MGAGSSYGSASGAAEEPGEDVEVEGPLEDEDDEDDDFDRARRRFGTGAAGDEAADDEDVLLD